MKGSKKEHDKIVRETLILLGKEAHKICRAFPHPTGEAQRERDWGTEYIRYGIDGSGDIIVFLITGRTMFLEIKSGSARQQPNQKKFEAMCKKFKIHYKVVRSKEEALDCVLLAVSSSA